MKKIILTLIVSCLIKTSFAQIKKDGTPDMRFNVNKGMIPPTNYNTMPNNSYRNYPNGGQIRIQKGYLKNNGTYINPHIKTTPDNVQWNNYKPRIKH